MIIQYLLYSYIVAIIVVQLVYKFAIKFKFTDKPNHRKVHVKPKALLGGLGIFITMALVYSAYLEFKIDQNTLIIFGLMFAILALGIYDDYYDMNPFLKFGCQIIIIVLTVQHLGGVSQISIFNNLLYLSPLEGKIVMFLWIIGLVNAFNLIDGLDGLATGSGIIATSTLIISAILVGDVTQVIIFLILLGALFGFLHFNFYPSKIFLGDAGSMLIGFTLAIYSMNEYKLITLSSLGLIFLMAFLPLLDVFLSFLRRRINGEKIYKADALHFHHRLLRKGFSHQQSVLLMYLFMIIYSMFGFLLNFADPDYRWIYMILLLVYTDFIIERFYLLSDKYRIFGKLYKKIFGSKIESKE